MAFIIILPCFQVFFFFFFLWVEIGSFWIYTFERDQTLRKGSGQLSHIHPSEEVRRAIYEMLKHPSGSNIQILCRELVSQERPYSVLFSYRISMISKIDKNDISYFTYRFKTYIRSKIPQTHTKKYCSRHEFGAVCRLSH